MQMAEKYRLPKITLTDEARQILLQYKWPGNVRQLKNITEQMSVLSEKREIDADTILHFIPRDQDSTQLAPYRTMALIATKVSVRFYIKFSMSYVAMSVTCDVI